MDTKDKQLKDKAINFKGKSYVQVADRVLYFNTEYPLGSIQTQLISDTKDDRVIVKAIVSPESNRVFTGYSQARWDDNTSFVNKTSALENAETSAVGRALAMMGIGVIESIASIDEVNKATNQEVKKVSTELVREPIKNELKVFCKICKSEMKFQKTGTRTDGTTWDMYVCPKNTLEDPHKPEFI